MHRYYCILCALINYLDKLPYVIIHNETSESWLISCFRPHRNNRSHTIILEP